MRKFVAVLILVASAVNLNAGEIKDSKCASGLCPLQAIKIERPYVVENRVEFSEQPTQTQTFVSSTYSNSKNCKPVVYHRKSIFRRR